MTIGHPWLLAADAPASPGGSFLVPLLLIVMIFYFLVIRPGSKERKQREAQLKSLKKHDRVITNAGIYGTVVALEDDSVVVRVDDKNNVRMKFLRSAIYQILSGDEKAGKQQSASTGGGAS